MYSIIIATLMATATVSTPTLEKPVEYFELARQAIFNCPNKNSLQIKPTVVFDLIEVERKYKVPKDLRGIVLTMNCLEKQGLLKKGLKKLRHWKGGSTKEVRALKLLDTKSKDLVKHSRFNKNNFKKTADVMLRRITTKMPVGQKGPLKEKWLKAWIKSIQENKPNNTPEPKKHLILLKKWHEKIKKEKKKNVVAGCTC